MMWKLIVRSCSGFYLAASLSVLSVVDALAVDAVSVDEAVSHSVLDNQPTITLNLHQAPLDQVIQQWAEQANVNVVLPEPSDQTLSVRMASVPMLEALELMATLAGLEAREHFGVWVVASKQHWQSVDASRALRHEEMVLKHRDAEAIMALIEPSLSDRGKITLDEQANRLWVMDTPAHLEAIKARTALLDQPIPQVLIESRIVIANRDFNKALGLRFGIDRQQADDASAGLSSAVADTGITSATGRINLSLLSARYRLDAELSALEASGQGRVISTPRVMVANRAEAFIQQGVSVPFEAVQSGEGAGTGAVSVQFKEAVLALKVTPLVLADGRIQLDLHITQDTVGQIFQTGRGGSVPSIDTRQLGTRVWVEDGQTLVLGGIFQEQDAKLMAGVPGLSQLPGVGRLFQRTSHDDQRRELLVFITPIVQP